MKKSGVVPVMEMEEFAVMGFSAVITALPRLWRHCNTLCKWILKENPAGVILIDYIEFNMHLGKTLRKKGYKGKIIQYVSPTVWAWRSKRAHMLAQNNDLLLTIYPFEEQYYKDTSLKVKYVGNPVKERISRYEYVDNWKDAIHLTGSDPLIALFPGSRKSEIDLNLPIQLAAAELLIRSHPQLRFALSYANEPLLEKIMQHVRESTLNLGQDLFLIPSDYSQELMHASTTALAKSGTVTLELALHNCPTVVMYELSWLNRFIAKYLIRLSLPHYCIVNIIANQEIFPEFYERGLSPKALAQTLEKLLDDTTERRQCIAGCHRVNAILGKHNASDNAATAIMECIQ